MIFHLILRLLSSPRRAKNGVLSVLEDPRLNNPTRFLQESQAKRIEQLKKHAQALAFRLTQAQQQWDELKAQVKAAKADESEVLKKIIDCNINLSKAREVRAVALVAAVSIV